MTVPVGLVALVTVIGPLVAPVGTVALSLRRGPRGDLGRGALNFTAEPGLNPTPLIVTDVPTAALVGLRPVIESVG